MSNNSTVEPECGWIGHCAGASCTTFNDCADDLACVESLCATPPGCSWPGHCAGATCSSHDECSDSLACLKGKCTTPPACSWEGHCEGAVCDRHEDCSDALACVKAVCTDTSSSGDGEGDGECGWAGHCEGSNCKVDGDCADDLACRDDVCSVVPSGPAPPPSRTPDPAESSRTSTPDAPDGAESSISMGAKVGIGVGVGSVALLLLAIAFLYRRKVSKARQMRSDEMQQQEQQNYLGGGGGGPAGFPSTAEYHAGAAAAAAASAGRGGSAPSYTATPASELPDTPKPHEIDSFPGHSPLAASELGTNHPPPVPPLPYGYQHEAVELPTAYNQNDIYGKRQEATYLTGHRGDTGLAYGQQSPQQGGGGGYGRGQGDGGGGDSYSQAHGSYDEVSPQSGRGTHRGY